MVTCTIGFHASAFIAQTVSIVDPSVTAEQLIAGLQDGTYTTTLAHEASSDPDISVIRELPSMKVVARIVSQESHDAEFEDIKNADDDDEEMDD